jgi:molybdopterin-guanine dinucleotide biosynthesis protein A
LSAAVVIVAGGEATRLPGKLALDAGGVPLVVRAFRALAPGRETFVSCKATFAPEIDAQLTAPLVVDRAPRRGPLGGLLSTFPLVRARYVAVFAGDAPFVDAATLAALERALRDGDEAVVPMHPCGRLEPLCALYDRLAFLREGFAVLHGAGASVAGVARRLRMRTIDSLGDAVLRSVNTPADYAAARARLGR